MPSPTYSSLLKLVATYVDQSKGIEVLARQLATANLTPDTLGPNDLKTLSVRLGTACSLYVSDAGKREELKGKIAAL